MGRRRLRVLVISSRDQTILARLHGFSTLMPAAAFFNALS
jgi:hypothetical protein